MCMRTRLKTNALLPDRKSGPEGVRPLNELNNLLGLKWCFRVPTMFLGSYITYKLVNKHMQCKKTHHYEI
jgi:hypothetical protein